MTIRFENGIVVTLGANNRVLWNATVVTEGEKVAAIGPAAKMAERFPKAEVVDCAGKIVLPGFLCSHHHFYSTMARGMAPPGEPASNFVEILERLWWKLDKALLEEDITLSAQIPLAECIRNGTTTIIDHHASPAFRDGSLDLIEKAVRDAGLRASLCYEVSDRNQPGGGIAENERFIKKTGKGDGQIAAMMGLHASFTLSDATLEKCVGIAARRRCRLSHPRGGGRRGSGRLAGQVQGARPSRGCTRWASAARSRSSCTASTSTKPRWTPSPPRRPASSTTPSPT